MFQFLEKLQSADEATKKRWLVVSTAVIMAIVIYVWLAYFNNLIAGFSGQQSAPVAVVVQPGAAGGGSFWQAAKSGLASLYQTFSDKMQTLGRILGSPREYIVKPLQ